MVRRDLWRGADVRWVRGHTDRDGVSLGPGTRAVVVDAGRHHVTSFGRLTRGGRRRPRRGVVIELDSGETARVRRRDIELVAPDHPLRPEPDATAADWILEQLEGWGTHGVPVAGFVPRSLPAVCRVLHPWFTTAGRPARWREVARTVGMDGLRALADRVVAGEYGDAEPFRAPGFGPPPREGRLAPAVAGRLVDALGPATTTPEDVLVAVWVGWGDIPRQRFPGAGLVEIPGRRHFLLRGPLEGVLTSISASPAAQDEPVSGLWWPADHAWVVSTEIDFAWTFVAGSRDLVDALMEDPDLDTLPADHDEPGSRLPA